jgi:hypothetical protein
MLRNTGTRPQPLELLALALLLACSRPSVQPAFGGDWIGDGKTGCRVWNPHPAAKESLAWSGACKDGFAEGRGVLHWFREGLPSEQDEGEWQRGRQVGRGLQVWPTGRYEGDVQDGLPHGRGILTFGESRYEGTFRAGVPHGTGVLTNPKGVFAGTWKAGCLGQQRASIGVDLSACP